MPTRNALGAIRLGYVQRTRRSPFHVNLQVWSHSYDHPDPAHRSAMIREVWLTGLQGQSIAFSNVVITDRYGVDHTPLWKPAGGGSEFGWRGYVEWDPAGQCGPGVGVVWGCTTGIYDERCLYDPACDAMRLQTYVPAPHRLAAYNYLLGPVTFSFNASLSAPPQAVRLVMGEIGGNGGDPASHGTGMANEEFIIQIP